VLKRDILASLLKTKFELMAAFRKTVASCCPSDTSPETATPALSPIANNFSCRAAKSDELRFKAAMTTLSEPYETVDTSVCTPVREI
jgi:hypothetical protein